MFNLIPLARRILIRAFKKDDEPGSFRHGYVANIACVIFDHLQQRQPNEGDPFLDMNECNVIAEAVMVRLFGDTK